MMGGREPPPYFSAITAYGSGPDHDKTIAALEARFSPHAEGLAILPQTAQRSRSMPFGRVVQVLELCSQTASRARQQEMVAELIAQTNLSADPVVERMALYRILMPSMDRRSVYGFKTTRLCHSFRYALRRLDSSASAVTDARLQQWLRSPELTQGRRAGTVICMPETAIAMAFGQCIRNSPHHRRQQGQQYAPLTIAEVVTLCQALTDSYTRKQREMLADSTQMLTAAGSRADKSRSKYDHVGELLAQVLPRMSYEECKFLVRLLLRTVPMGVGPMTVLAAISADAAHFLSRQRDLTRLAIWTAPVQAGGGGANVRGVRLAYGVPFTPMTCGTVSSPYMMRWMFSKEESSGTPITPKQGRLIVMSSGTWCMPVNGTRVGQNLFADIEDPMCVEVKSRKRHVELLKQFRRGGMLNEEHARGLLINYMLCTEGHNKVVMLLRSVLPAAAAGIEFADERHAVEDPLLYADDGEQQENNNDEGAQEEEEEEEEDNDDDWTRRRSGRIAEARQKKKKPQRRQAPQPKSKPKPGRKGRGTESLMDNEEIAARLRRIMAPPDPVSWVGHSLQLRVASVFDEEKVGDARKTLVKNGMIVQTKLDGDRLQAHVYRDGERQLHVHLFTKHGKSVDALYSDVTDDLRRAFSSVAASVSEAGAGCMLDGELVLMDSKNNFLPWSSVKWRYNTSSTAEPRRLSEILQDKDEEGIVTVVCDDECSMQGQDVDATPAGFTMAPRRTLRNWDGLGAAEQRRTRARVLQQQHGDARLVFVVFDVLMLGPKDITGDPCLTRWGKLQEVVGPLLKGASIKHVQVLGNEHMLYAKTATVLVERMQKAVQMRYEGVVAKDPRGKYKCGESTAVRKIKVQGHDVNAVVLGAGFTMSANPRMWGLMTGYLHAAAGDAAEDVPIYKAYVRVESIEGDEPGNAMNHVCGLQSSVSVAALTHVAPRPIKVGPYMVSARYSAAAGDGGGVVVRWSTIVPEREAELGLASGCEVHFPLGFPRDLQWVCNPHDCAFTMSLHGDLFPVSKDDGALCVVRFPVGRLEFSLHQSSKCDTAESIAAKFRESASDAECMRLYFERKIRTLRRQPSTPQKLDQVYQMLLGKQTPSAPWPEQPPVLYSIQKFSKMLADSGFGPLTAIEARAIRVRRSGSQWTNVDLKRGVGGGVGGFAAAPLLPKTMAENERTARKQVNLDALCARLGALRSIKRPTLRCSSSSWPGDVVVAAAPSSSADDDDVAQTAPAPGTVWRRGTTTEEEEDEEDEEY